MGGCSAVNCTSHSRKGIRMVGFPSDKERRKQWLINCGRGNWEPGRGAQLCIAHFEESQFEQRRQDNWKKLKYDAVPTIFNKSVNKPDMYPAVYCEVKLEDIVNDNAEEQSCSFITKGKSVKKEIDDEEVNFSSSSKDNIYTKLSDKQGTSWLLVHNSPNIVENQINNSTVEEFKKNLLHKNHRILRNILSDPATETVQDLKGYWCPVCFRFLTRISEFDRHLRLHGSSRIHKCQKCSKLFSALGLHHHLQNYVCKKCWKCFNTRDLLDQHLFVDEGIRNYVCKICGKSYFLKAYLTSHLKKHENPHLKNTEIYTCETCGKCFKCKLSLTQHFLAHEGIKRYICEICGRGFVHKSSLIKHKFFHTGIKNYVCEICDKRFAMGRTYNRHLVIHEGTKKYKCDKCGKTFNRKDNLNTHISSHNRF